ncbi:MAG TPA: serine hydrolase [Longimicrobium sp.]|jgi:CubicO group peptidase (beta-lactamase class C family)
MVKQLSWIADRAARGGRRAPRWGVALALAAAVAPSLDAQERRPPAAPFPAELDRYVADVLEQWRIPGLAIAVVRNDSTLVAKGYGVRRLGSPDPVDERTVFDIAGLTSSFTATAAAMLVDRGALRWDDPVRRHLPTLVLPTDSLTRQATVRDFLSHRTGLDPAPVMAVLAAADRDDLLRRMRHLRVVAPFRQTAVPSAIGYTVAGEAAAAAARMPFESVLRDLVVRRLQLPRTTWTYEQAATMSNIAAPHATLAGRQQEMPRDSRRGATAPADAVQSGAADLTRWMRLHLNDGVLDGTRYVSDSTMREMHRVQVNLRTSPAFRTARLMQDTVFAFGMGWQISDYRGHRILWHGGAASGQAAYMALFPEDRLGVVVLVNTSSAGATQVPFALVNRIADTYLGYEPRDWAGEAFARRPNADSLREVNERAMRAMRASAPPRLPLAAYAGRYDHPLFGPVHVRVAGSALTLQMGQGRLADLESHGNDAFYVQWRDPSMRETFGAHVVFATSGDSALALSTVIGRDQFMAREAGAGASVAAAPRPDLAGVEALLADSAFGRWNLQLLGPTGPNDVSSSWLEIERSGFEGLVGRYVGLIGGARPIGRIDWSRTEGVARFSIPMEWELIPASWEVPSRDLRFEVRPAGDSLIGTLVYPAGVMRAFVGRRAPGLLRDAPKAWTEPVALFNGKDLSGWTIAPTARSLPSFWVVRDGILVNTANEGANLMTVQRFQDFKLHAEFRHPGPGASGIFPRGRYWVILRTTQDTRMPARNTTGAVHKFLVPSENAGLGVGVWQSIDITMVGRRITVVVNGRTVISDQIVPGITGSAIDGDEAAPGPIMLQGEENPIEFRNITLSVPQEGGAPSRP